MRVAPQGRPVGRHRVHRIPELVVQAAEQLPIGKAPPGRRRVGFGQHAVELVLAAARAAVRAAPAGAPLHGREVCLALPDFGAVGTERFAGEFGDAHECGFGLGLDQQLGVDDAQQRELLAAQGVTVNRYRKPTFTRPAPTALRQQIAAENQLVIEGLAD